MNYRNDLHECLTCFKFTFESNQFHNFELPNLLSHFNKSLGMKVTKLLESYDMTISSTKTSLLITMNKILT
jgi:hypothetical protein